MGALSFLVTIAFVSPFPDGALMPRWAVLSIAVPILVFRTENLHLTLGHALYAAFLAVAGLSLLWTPAPYDGLYIFWHFLLFGGVLLIAPEDLRPVWIGAGLALIVNAAVVLAQVAGFDPVNQAVPPAGLFMNKNVGAEAAALVIVGLLATRPVLATGAVVVACAAPLFSPPLSRGAILAVGVAFLAWLWTKHRFAAALIAILLAGLALRFALDLGRWDSAVQRLSFWAHASANLTWFGHGLGSFRWAYPFFEHAHNDLLQLAYELGVGACLFVAFLVVCLWRGPLPQRLVLLAFITEGFFAFPLYMPATSFLAACAAGSLLRSRPALRWSLDRRERGGDAGHLDTRNHLRRRASSLPERRRPVPAQ